MSNRPGMVARAAVAAGLALSLSVNLPTVARAIDTVESQSQQEETVLADDPAAFEVRSSNVGSTSLDEMAEGVTTSLESASEDVDTPTQEREDFSDSDSLDISSGVEPVEDMDSPQTSLETSEDPERMATSSDGLVLEEDEELQSADADDHQNEESAPSVLYDAHMQDIGWQHDVEDSVGWDADGTTAGTTGESRRLEAVRIVVDTPTEEGGVRYQAHVQDIGWQDWVQDGAFAGTVGESKRLEAIRLALYGDLEKRYSIYYRVHVQDYGWLGWTKNGEVAGSTGLGLRLEALEARLVETGSADVPDTSSPAYIPGASLVGSGHVQDIGWQAKRSAALGSILTIGTTGQAKRLEAINIGISSDADANGQVLTNAHVANVGWQADIEDPSTWKRGDNIITGTNGTTGRSLSIEALQLKLAESLAPYYDLYYRAHVADYGWLDWTSDGYVAGTSGLSKQMEAVQVCLALKGTKAPGSTDVPYMGKGNLLSDKVNARVQSSAGASVTVEVVGVGKEQYLFLPAFSDEATVRLDYKSSENGRVVMWNGADDGTAEVSPNASADLSSLGLDRSSTNMGAFYYQYSSAYAPQRVRVMRSANIGALFLTSKDPTHQGREWVEASSDHSRKAKGDTYSLVDADGSAVEGALDEIKGRGNSTWALAKRPYQIKTKKKVNLIGGSSSNASKKWVLLANYADATLLRNYIALNVGRELGLTDTPECRSVDLYYDGDYRGTYLLTEKVEVGKGRVNIDEIENDSTNGTPIEDHGTAQKTNNYGNVYQYVTGVSSPTDISGGYLLEVDQMYASERSWFEVVADGIRYHVVLKSPEDASESEVRYISEYLQSAINGVNSSSLSKFDLDSLAKTFLVQEFTRNYDYIHHSSTYLYKDAGHSHLISGPLWDFDLTLGGTRQHGSGPTEGLISEDQAFFIKNYEFRKRVKDVFNYELKPLANNVLLGESLSGGLSSVGNLASQLSASQRMNYCVWGNYSDIYISPSRSYKTNTNQLKDWISKRVKWLDAYFNSSAWL